MGTLYVAVYESTATDPTTSAHVTTTDWAGSGTVIRANNPSVSADGAATISVTGLTAGTTYKAAYVYYDGAEYSDILIADDETGFPFTTQSAAATGDLSATETGTDTSALSGAVQVTGDIAATEIGSDTAAINGSAPTLIFGDLAATETGIDTAALSGTVVVSGSLAITESGSDDLTASGFVVPFGSGFLSAQESGNDTVSATGTLRVAGTLSAVETGTDTAAISGQAPTLITGTLDVFESGSDSAVAIGSVQITGTLTSIETGSDSAVIRQNVLSTGTLAATESESDSTGIAGFTVQGYGAMYQATIDVNYRIHGRSVVYKNVAGTVSMVRAIIETDEDLQPAGEVQVRYPTYIISIRTSELAEPERGATIQFPGETYIVDGFDPVSEWEWRLYART